MYLKKKEITNLLHQDQADLQQYIKWKCQALYVGNPSGKNERILFYSGSHKLGVFSQTVR